MADWDNRFISLAKLVSTWSRDPSTGVGGVLTDSRNRIISVAFNGFPRRINDSPERLYNRAIKYSLTLHCEQNLLIFAEKSVRGATCYTWPLPPCSQCASALIQAGIARVVAPAPSPDLADRWGESIELAVMAMREAGIKVDILDNTGGQL